MIDIDTPAGNSVFLFFVSDCILIILQAFAAAFDFYPEIWSTVWWSTTILWTLLAAPILIFCYNQKWFCRLLGAIDQRWIPVQLIDHTGSSSYSIAIKTKQGNLESYVYWIHRIGSCTLLPNGIVDPNSDSSYMYFWLPLRKAERVSMLLTHSFPDFDAIQKMERDNRWKTIYYAREKLLSEHSL